VVVGHRKRILVVVEKQQMVDAVFERGEQDGVALARVSRAEYAAQLRFRKFSADSIRSMLRSAFFAPRNTMRSNWSTISWLRLV
jgi:hypothetical protein